MTDVRCVADLEVSIATLYIFFVLFAAMVSGVKEQAAYIMRTYAQCAFLIPLQMGEYKLD